MNAKNNPWPDLDFEKARDTYETLHLWTQIVGKIKLAKMPWINHSWHVALQISPTGFTTSSLPHNGFYFQIDFDFLDHQLQVKTNTGDQSSFQLEGLSVADFYHKLRETLKSLGIEVPIYLVPNELEEVIPFDQDQKHSTYIPEHAQAVHKAFLLAQEVLTEFRAGFTGKCSPVHFFWGSFDLAVTRFSGRPAPVHPGGVPHLPDRVVQEAYSQEVSSCGFWPGNEAVPFAAFYSYAYPEPEGFASAPIQPSQAYYDQTLREFILPYQAVQQAKQPRETLLQFLQTTYEAAANLAYWKRKELESHFSNL